MRSAIIGYIVCLLVLPLLLACDRTSGRTTTSPTANVADTTPIAATKVVSPTPSGTTPVMLGVLGKHYPLKVGQMVRFLDQEIVIRFTGVTNDMRCPISLLYCVSPGEATVAFEMMSGGGIGVFNDFMPGPLSDPSWNGDYPRTRTVINGYIIQIVGLFPQRGGESDVPPLTPIPMPTPYPTVATIQVTTVP